MTIQRDVDLVEKRCGSCGMVFACPDWFEEDCRENGRSWYCPAGHCRLYTESTVDKLRRELAEERTRGQQQADQLKTAERERKRQEKRSSAGVCPCCKRSYVQMARHMKTKHPTYAD